MSDSPRILVVAFTPFPAPTGEATRLAQRVTAFADAGYSLDVLTPKTAELPHVSKLLGARILRVPMPFAHEALQSNPLGVRTGQTLPPGIFTPIGHMDSVIAATLRALAQPPMPQHVSAAALDARYAAFERAVRRQLQSVEYDVVHTLDPYSAVAIAEQKGGARLTFEASGRTPSGEGDAALHGELRSREREAFRVADLVLVPTEEVALRARGLGALRDNIHVVRPSADLELFRPPDDRRRRVTSPVRLALTASLLTHAEFSLIADAMAILPSVLEVHLHLSAAVEDKVRERLSSDDELCARVTLEDPLLYEDLGPLYQRAHIGVLVSTGPVNGELPPPRLQALAEMMASGLAIVAPDVAPVREICEDGRHAVLVPPDDAEAFSEALRSLVSNPTRRRSLGQAARTRAGELLDERRATAKVLSLYGTMLSPSVSIAASAYMEPSITAPGPAGDPISGPSDPGGRALPLTTSSLSEEAILALQASKPRRPRVPLSTATVSVGDDPTDPDMAIQKRVLLADLSSASTTDPDAHPTRERS